MTPLKITIDLETPAMIERKSAFDSVLAKLYFNKLERAGLFRGDYAMPLEFLQNTDGVYHTSWPVFEKTEDYLFYNKEIILKKFNDSDFQATGDWIKSDKKRVNKSSGSLKSVFEGNEVLPYSRVVYYVCGIRSEIAELLGDLGSLGKKSGFGWGKIKNITIEPIEEDRSLIHRGAPMRNLPLDNSLGYTGDLIALHRLIHPYWKREDLVPCYFPEHGV